MQASRHAVRPRPRKMEAGIRIELMWDCFAGRSLAAHATGYGGSRGTLTLNLPVLKAGSSNIELGSHKMVRLEGIGPSQPRWQRGILPLNYRRIMGAYGCNVAHPN